MRKLNPKPIMADHDELRPPCAGERFDDTTEDEGAGLGCARGLILLAVLLLAAVTFERGMEHKNGPGPQELELELELELAAPDLPVSLPVIAVGTTPTKTNKSAVPLFAWPVVLLVWPGKNAQPPASCVFTCPRSPAPPFPVDRRAEVQATAIGLRDGNATRVAALDVLAGCLLAPPAQIEGPGNATPRPLPDYETGPWTSTLAELGGEVTRLWIDGIGPVAAATVASVSALELLGFGNTSVPRLLPLCDVKLAVAAQLSADAYEEREALLSAPWRLGPWAGPDPHGRLPLFHPDRALAALCMWDPGA